MHQVFPICAIVAFQQIYTAIGEVFTVIIDMSFFRKDSTGCNSEHRGVGPPLRRCIIYDVDDWYYIYNLRVMV